MDERVQSVVANVRRAFADNKYSGDDRLTVYDRAGRDYDETHQLLCGRNWQDLPIADFMAGDTPIPDLTPEAFHYYLPGLLIFSLGNDYIAGDVANAIAFYLSPDSARSDGEFAYDDTERFHQRIALLDQNQRAAIQEVLAEYVARQWITHDSLQGTLRSLQDIPTRTTADARAKSDASQDQQ